VDKAPVTPVAVIGMACRLPGSIDSPDRLWEALLGGDDPITEIPPDRWNADDYYDPEPAAHGRSVSRWGVSWARHTSPMPPRPSSSTRR
jgi:polyketide synthase 5